MILQVDNFNVFPLFPTTVAVCIVKEDISNLRSIQNLDYKLVNEGNESGAEISTVYDLLDHNQKEKQILINYFHQFAHRVLRLESMQFDITTSWATRVSANINTQSHNHKNCFYSGVLYLDKLESGGELEFENAGINPISFLTSPPREYNIFNYETFFIEPKENLLVFFPSYLRHRIKKHTMSNYRYSIAFNIMPVGKFGRGDSTINIQIIKDA